AMWDSRSRRETPWRSEGMPIRKGSAREPPQPAASTGVTQAKRTASALARIADHPEQPAPYRDRLGALGDVDGAHDTARRRVDAGHGVVDRRGDPDAPGADCDASGAA